MRVSFTALLAGFLAFPALAAEEGALRSEWQPYASPAQKSVAKSAPDPFTAAPPPERASLMTLKSGVSCGALEFEVCLDATGRLTVPGAKRYLPELPGLKPERLTVRRSGLVLGYSF